MGSWNGRILDLSPWAFAALWATVMVSGGTLGRVFYGWAAGEVRLLEWLLIGGSTWIVLFPVFRLLAPATLQAMRQHELWREERRRQRLRQA